MDIKDRLEYAEGAFLWCRKAFEEISQIISAPDTETEHNIARGHTFSFYYFSLQYMVIMEYCKLTEPESNSNNGKNIASLSALLEEAKLLLPEETYSSIREIINDIVSSDLTSRLRDLRNWKYAHIDGGKGVSATRLESFSFDQITRLQLSLIKIEEVLNKLTEAILSQSNLASFLDQEDRTANFIKFHAEYEDFFYKNGGMHPSKLKPEK